MFEKLPNLQIITHHFGGMVPFLSHRVGYGMDQFGSRTADEDYEGLRKRMKKRPIDYFKMFYNDTSINGSASGMRCGLDFFGKDKVLFGTDCPFDPRAGRCSSARPSRRSIPQAQGRPAPRLFRQRAADAQDGEAE